MKLSRKRQKLLSTDSFGSAFEHLSRGTHPVNKRRILETLDRAQFEKLREQYPYRPGSPRINRFEDVVYWIEINIERAQDLWLDRAPPIRIVDLGSGAGYFLSISKSFAEEVLGLDTDNEPLFRATTALLDVPRVIGRIERQTPLPDLGGKFDLVTAHRICFHRIGHVRDGVEWAAADWEFVINDIRTRFLNEHVRLLLDFNPHPDSSAFLTPRLREFFAAPGAPLC